MTLSKKALLFIKSKLGFSLRAEKESLVKEYLKSRIRDENINVNPFHVDSLSFKDLMLFPEATIVTISELYSILRNNGNSHKKSITEIEQIRRLNGYGDFDVNSSLIGYVAYRMKIEHRGDLIHKDHISKLIKDGLEVFAYKKRIEPIVNENRAVAIFSGIVFMVVAVGSFWMGGYFVILTAIFGYMSWMSFKIAAKANEVELMKLTGDLPEMPDNQFRDFIDRME